MNVNERLQRVLALHKAGQIDEAIEGYRSIIPLVPQNIQVSLYGNLGALLMNQGDFSSARDQFAAAVEIAPQHASSQFNLAVLLTSKFNEHAKALKHCALAIRADPSSHKAYHLMGNIMQNLGKHKEAEKYFEQAEELAGSDASSQQRMAASAGPTRRLQDLLRYSMEVGSISSFEWEGRTLTMKCLSQAPLIFVVDDFLSREECNSIISSVETGMEKSFVMGSQVVDTQAAKEGVEDAPPADSGVEDPRLYRSSYTAWLPRNAALESVQQRLALLLDIPLPYLQHKSEDLQVVKYNLGGQFKAHQDSSSFHPRLLTALFYLRDGGIVQGDSQQDGLLGGQTWFPFARSGAEGGGDSHLQPPSTIEDAVLRALEEYEQHPSSLAGERLPGLKVHPKAGRAVIFFNYDIATGELDPKAVHAGLPIYAQGELASSHPERLQKWVANYWVENDSSLLADLMHKSH